MIERDKQVDDQQKKQAKHEADMRSKKNAKAKPEQQHAGMATDPETMKDKDYVKRIEEKTEKH
jgi:hypothetical protein